MSSSLQQNKFLEVPLQNAVTLYNNEVVPRLTKKNKVIAISVAVALSLVYIIQDRVFKPPRNLRHIPYFGYFSVIKSLMNGESIFDRGYKYNVPHADCKNSNGLYLEPGRAGWEVHVSNPEDAKRILLKHGIYPKFNLNAGIEDTLLTKFVGGPNVLTLAGHEWKNQRKVTNPAFRRSMPVKLFGKLTQELFKVMDTMDENVDISDLMLRWTLEAIGKAGFGFDFHAIDDVNSKWVNVYTDINDGLRDRKFFSFPILDQKFLWLFPKRRQLHKKMNYFLDMLDDVIKIKRDLLKKGHVHNDDLEENERDLLTLMIESENRDEGNLSDAELKSNLCVFFFAGHDTTAAALSFALYHLAKHLDIQEKAREEAIAILGDELKDVCPTAEQTKQMTYINQIMKETLRINDPAPRVFPRVVTEDTVLSSGTFIPKGSLITVNIFNIHHSDKVWSNPEQFDPDRFAEDGEGVRESGEGMAYLPFGNGARQCLGMNFSLNEQRVMLSMILRKYTWILPENSKHKYGLITGGLPVVSPTDLDLTFHRRY